MKPKKENRAIRRLWSKLKALSTKSNTLVQKELHVESEFGRRYDVTAIAYLTPDGTVFHAFDRLQRRRVEIHALAFGVNRPEAIQRFYEKKNHFVVLASGPVNGNEFFVAEPDVNTSNALIGLDKTIA